MRAYQILIFVGAVVLGLVVRGQSQAPGAVKSPVQLLQSIKAANQTQLDKQAALVVKLDELHKAATQTKFLTNRG